MRHLLLSAMLCITATFSSFSQKLDTLYRWGDVSPEDLAMKTYSLDTSADAVVLFDIAYQEANYNNYYGFSSDFIRHKRVKILKKSAFEREGNVKIDFHLDLLDFNGQIIQPDGTKTVLKDSDLLVEKTQGKSGYLKFAFPNLQEGSIIEYRYIYPNNGNMITLEDQYFQEDIPIRKKELFLKLRTTVGYKYFLQGANFKEDRLPPNKVINIINNFRIDSTYTRIYLDSIPAMKEEGYVTTMNDYKNRVRFQLSEYPDEFGKPKKFLADWKEVSKVLLKEDMVCKQYLKGSNYNSLWKAVKKQINDTMSVENKIKNIYYYISKNVAWIDDYFSISSTDGLDAAFEKKKANSGELNLMLIACLNKAEIPARPLLISTRDNGAPVEEFPIVMQFNHLLCYTELNGAPLILDAGNIHRPIGVPRVSSLNGKGLLIDENNPRWVPIKAPLSSEAMIANFELTSDGHLKGVFSSSHQGYSGVNERTNAYDDPKHEKLKKDLAKDFPDIEIDSIVIQNLDNVSEIFKRKVYCTIKNVAIVANDLMYIKPSLKTDYDESPFKQANRNYPVDIPYPTKDNFVLNLTIPNDYEIEELPKTVNVGLANNAAKFSYLHTVNANRLQLVVNVQLNQLHYETSEYGVIKDFFAQIAAKQTEQIVLKKKPAKSN